MSGALNALICLFVWLNWTEYLASFTPNPIVIIALWLLWRTQFLLHYSTNSIKWWLRQCWYPLNDIFNKCSQLYVDGMALSTELMKCCWSLLYSQSTALNPGQQLSTCVLEMMKRECENHKLCEPFWFDLTTAWFHGLLHSQRPFLQITSQVGIWKCLGSSSHGLDQRFPEMQDHNQLAY